MVRLPSLVSVLRSAQETERRFPWTLLFAFISGSICWLLIGEWQSWKPYETVLSRLLLPAMLGISVFFALTLWLERSRMADGRHWVGLAVGLTVLAVFGLSYDQDSPQIYIYRFLQLALASHLLAAVVPFHRVGSVAAFWEFNRILFQRILQSVLFSSILYAGLAIALWAVQSLLGVKIDWKAYYFLFLSVAFLFNTWFFLAGVPTDWQQLETEYEYPKDSGVWWVVYYDQYKRRHREKVGLKSAAVSIYQQRKTEIRQGKFDPEDVLRKHRNALVSEIIEDFIKASEARNRKSIDDIRQRLRYWETRLGDRAAKSVLNSDIEEARLELAQGRLPGHRHRRRKEPRAVATVNRYLATLKSVFLLAIENEKVTRNPFRKVKLQKENNARVRYLTEEEQGRLFAVLPTQYHALVLLAMQTGLRRMELFRVQWDDINLQRRFLRVRESKSGLGRNLPLNDVALSTLQRIPRRIGNPFVFPGDKAGTHRTDVPKSWEGFLKRAGIVGFKWHDLRHTFASRLVMAGVDLYAVSKLLGHVDIKMTQRYSHLSEGHLNEAVNRLNSFSTATKTATNADPKTKMFR